MTTSTVYHLFNSYLSFSRSSNLPWPLKSPLYPIIIHSLITFTKFTIFTSLLVHPHVCDSTTWMRTIQGQTISSFAHSISPGPAQHQSHIKDSDKHSLIEWHEWIINMDHLLLTSDLWKHLCSPYIHKAKPKVPTAWPNSKRLQNRDFFPIQPQYEYTVLLSVYVRPLLSFNDYWIGSMLLGTLGTIFPKSFSLDSVCLEFAKSEIVRVQKQK